MPENKREEPEKSIQLVIFIFMGVKFGIDSSQIYKLLKLDEARESEYKLHKFHEKIGFLDDHAVYKMPRVALLKNTPKNVNGIIIDCPEDIVSLKRDSIKPLPVLLESSLEVDAIWGIFIKGEDIVILVDLSRL